ncbi:MAG: hypothetical protein CMH98_13490, partial [Oceanospirillaceae bacterium]|nr:hypothetical protein [Oceanospirillaceae bacterium]
MGSVDSFNYSDRSYDHSRSYNAVVDTITIGFNHDAQGNDVTTLYGYRFDNFKGTTSLAAPNTDPAISLSGTALGYTENDSATQIDASGTLTDTDGDADWDSGTLVVQITGNNEAADELSIVDVAGGTTISISGTDLKSGAITIGTLSASGGTVTNNTALTITFNSNATNALVQEVLQSLHYRNTSDNPGTSNRTITITATDKSGGSHSDTRTVEVAAENDAPVLADTTPSLTAINEDAGDDDGDGGDGDNDASSNADNQGDTVADLLTAAITDPDGSAVEAIAVTVVDNTNGVWQYTTDGTNWNNFTATTGSSVNLESSNNSILLDSANKVRFVPDQNYNGSATFTFRAWDKSDGGTAGSTATTSANGGTTAFSTATDTASVTVNAVNDAPAFTGLDATPTFTEGSGAVVFDSNVTVSDLELNADSYDGATLTIARNGGANPEDVFASTGNLTDGTDTDLTQGANITLSSENIGTITTNSNGTLVLTFNSNATQAKVNEVMQALTYSNTGQTHAGSSVQMNWTFSDGITVSQGSGGAQSDSGSITFTVNSVNDAPVFSDLDATAAYTEDGSAVVLDSNATLADVELDAANNYDGATLTISRNGGADSDDVFAHTGTLSALTESGTLVVGGTTVGTVTTNSSGTLQLTFNGSATTALVDSVLQQITYSNSSDTPDVSVTLDYSFSDGNSGGQGTGGAETATGSVTVGITATNDAPVISGLDGDTVIFQVGTTERWKIDTGDQAIPATQATVTDADHSNFDGGRVYIENYTVDATPGYGDFSVDGTTVTSGGNAVIGTGEDIVVSNVLIGTVDTGTDGVEENGQGGGNLLINLNSNATPALIGTLLQNLYYLEDTSITEGGDAIYSITIKDSASDDGDSDPVTVTFTGTMPTLTSATYDASTGTLVVTGADIPDNSSGVDIDASLLTLTGEGGDTYQLTDTSDVERTSATEFTLTLSATDQAALNLIMNKNGTTSTDNTTFNLAGADNWAMGAPASVDIADATGNGVTVSNVPAPEITSATYNTSTGVLVVTGTGFTKSSGADNDIDVTKLTFTGVGNGTRTLSTSTDVEITDGTRFTLTLSGGDKTAVDALLDANGTDASDSVTYNLAAAEDWIRGADASVTIADLTGNGITVSGGNVEPEITSGDGDTAAVSMAENITTVTTVTATDAEDDPITFSITGGDDAALFTIDDTSGVLSFLQAPNASQPTDTGSNSVYDIEVTASDDQGGQDTQTISVTVLSDTDGDGDPDIDDDDIDGDG